jgi:Na+/H+-dicarboxylate symporter
MKLPLHIKIVIGLLAGIFWAILSVQFNFTNFTLDYIQPFGEIFINLLKMIALPLVLFSILQGIVNMSDVKRLGSLGIKTLILYLFTTIVAVSTGLLVANIIRPGHQISIEQKEKNKANFENYKNGITNNALNIEQKLKDAETVKSSKPLQFLVDMVPSNVFKSFGDSSLMLQVIFFALLLGIAILFTPLNSAKPFIDFINSGNDVFLKMVDIVMAGSPYFVFALLAGKITEMAGNSLSALAEILSSLGWYSATVVVGLLIILLLFYPVLIHFSKSKIKYLEFLKVIRPAQLMAFSTSSSAATLPVTIECVKHNLKVSDEVSGFVLPIGATINMDGTSLYQAVAVIFLAQFHDIDLNIAQQLTIVLTATLASIGSAAVPGAGLMMLIIVLESVGLNPAWIAIIMPVDRILDMCRTVINITSDCCVCLLTDTYKK